MSYASTARVLEPGWIVVCGLNAKGCASYAQADRRETTRGVELDGTWLSSKHVKDIEEHAAVRRAYSGARRVVARAGFDTLAGVFIPISRRGEMEQALSEARRIIDEHNAVARYTQIVGSFLVFAVSSDNTAAALSLVTAAEDCLSRLEDAIGRANVKDIRKALSDARGLDAVFSAKQSEVLRGAFDQARRAARQMAKAAKAGETDLAQFARSTTDVRVARVMFAELGEARKVEDVPVFVPRVLELDTGPLTSAQSA